MNAPRRRSSGTGAADAHYLRVSKGATAFWGLFASVTALYAANLGSLIDVVNRFGSFFYGSLLGVFVLAVGMRRATVGRGRAAYMPHAAPRAPAGIPG